MYILNLQNERGKSQGYFKFEPYGDLVDEVYSRFSEILINNQDHHKKTN